MGKDKVEDVTKPPKTADQTNPVEESKATGTATTDDGREVAATPGAVPEDAPDVNETEDGENPNAALAIDVQEDLKGELTGNEQGWLPLNEEGYITGRAKRGQPPEDQPFAYVACNGEYQKGFAGQILTTPAGAPITRKMNPDTRKDADHNENAKKALDEQGGDKG